MRINIQVDGNWVPVDVDKKPSDKDIDEIAADIRRSRKTSRPSRQLSDSENDLISQVHGSGPVKSAPRAPYSQDRAATENVLSQLGHPHSEPLSRALGDYRQEVQRENSPTDLNGLLRRITNPKTAAAKIAGNELRKFSVKDLFNEDALQQIRNGSPTVRLGNVDIPLAHAVKLYQKETGRGVSGKPNTESELGAYTGFGAEPGPAETRLGSGKHNASFFHGAQEAVGGLALGAGGILSPSLQSTAHEGGARLAQAVGTWVANVTPAFWSGLGAEGPAEALGNIAGGAILHGVTKLAPGVPGAFGRFLEKVIPDNELAKAQISAKAAGYPSLEDFLENSPELHHVRAEIRRKVSPQPQVGEALGSSAGDISLENPILAGDVQTVVSPHAQGVAPQEPGMARQETPKTTGFAHPKEKEAQTATAPSSASDSTMPEVPIGSPLPSSEHQLGGDSLSGSGATHQTSSYSSPIPEEATGTSTKNEVTSSDREAFGLSELPGAERESFEGWLKEARETGLTEKSKVRDLADRVLGSDKHAHLTPVENAAVADRMAHLKTEYDDLESQFGKAHLEGDTAEKTRIDGELRALRGEYDHLSQATKKGGTPIGQALVARKLTLGNDFHILSVIGRAARAKESAGLGALTDAEAEELKSQVKELNVKLAEAEEFKRATENANLIKDRHIGRLEQYAASERKANRQANLFEKTNQRKAQIRIERASTIEDLKTAWDKAKSSGPKGREVGAFSHNFTPEVIHHLGRIAKTYIDEGVTNLKDLTDKINIDVQFLGEKLSESDVKEAFDKFAINSNRAKVKSATARVRERISDTEKEIRRLTKEISDLQSGKVRSTQKRLGPPVPEVAKLRTERDKLKAALPKIPKSDASAIAKVKERISDTEKEIRSKFVAAKSEPKVPTGSEELQNARAKLKKLQGLAKLSGTAKKLDHMMKLNDDDFMEAHQKLEAQREAAKVKTEAGKDAAYHKLESDIRIKKEAINARITELSKSRFQKLGDRILGLQRFNLVSGASTFGKIGATSLMNFVTSPIESLAGNALKSTNFGKLTPESQGSIMSGYAAVSSLIKSVSDKDWWVKAKTGMNSLDREAFSRGLDIPHAGEASLPNLVYRIHGAITTPSQRAAFASEAQKLTKMMVKAGQNPAQEENVAKIFAKAYEASLRTTGFNENKFASLLSGVGKSLANPKYGATGKIAQFGFRSEVPFTRLPSNAVGRSMEGIFGLPYGVGKLIGHSVTNTLDEKAAGEIARAFKRGSAGLGLMLTGYYGWKSGKIRAGGYYDPGKPSQEGLRPGELEIMGYKIPRAFTFPWWMAPLNVGATIAQFEGRGEMDHAALNVGRGLVDEAPGVGSISELGKAGENESAAGRYLGSYAKGFLEPAPVQDLARALDKRPNGGVTERASAGFRDTLKTGIPNIPLLTGISRNTLPVKGSKKRRAGRSRHM